MYKYIKTKIFLLLFFIFLLILASGQNWFEFFYSNNDSTSKKTTPEIFIKYRMQSMLNAQRYAEIRKDVLSAPFDAQMHYLNKYKEMGLPGEEYFNIKEEIKLPYLDRVRNNLWKNLAILTNSNFELLTENEKLQLTDNLRIDYTILLQSQNIEVMKYLAAHKYFWKLNLQSSIRPTRREMLLSIDSCATESNKHSLNISDVCLSETDLKSKF